ncbi:efflux RND transporter permease subunit [Gracilimonas mengyeensis]|uniref:Hydrophobic/amphiphilic exporter-1, HAE1 family n=1 Tax=Gracilimonas mengyeensis TaxID=1302730 RepID=A0A521B5R6_9BACT|nr:efflux RND transporter permease subunit [Gracilimonas mengyeensis]SMO42429.1 hydrophobic/amphiphilic exporter-1, HAE1 family [Gracilimonas mengyeensis]
MLLKKPIASVILVLAVLIFGSIALERLSIELMPDIARPTLLVRTDYTGAPASEVEFRVTEQLEGMLSGVRGVQQIESLSRQGQSLIFLTFEWGFDMDIAFLNVREKLDQARYLLPNQAERPQLVYSSASDEPIATIALQLKNASNQAFDNRLSLKRWADQVFTRRLEQQDGIAQALLVGEVQPEVQIRFNPRFIDRYGLSLSQIQQAVQDANLFSSTGELRDGWYRYALKIESRIESLEDLRKTPVISLASGRVLLLEELADVRMDEADPTSFALLDGEEVLNVLVKKEYGSNTVEVFETLEEVLKEIRSQNPDIAMEVIQEDASYIENSISNLLQTLLIGGVLAFLVLFLFLDDARSPFTIGISIPVSIFLTFVVMYLFDIQLNIISLSGLTLGIGLLLDNAIVVLENISRYRQKGLGRFEAAREGTKEISLAVTASTFTTISVFLPLIFLGGFEGAFFRDLAATLSFSLIASLLVALFILPVFVAQISKESKSEGMLSRISAMLDKVVMAYERNLGRVIKKPMPLVITALILLTGAGVAFMTIPKAVLPPDEPSEVEYLVSMPGNTALRSAKAAAVEITNILLARTDQTNILSLGGYTDNTNLRSITNEGLNRFTLSVPVSGFEEAEEVDRLMEGIADTYANWSFRKMDDNATGAVGIGQDAPVQFSVVGTDRNFSARVAAAYADFMNRNYGEVELNLKYPQRIDAYQVQFKTEELLAYELAEDEIIRYLESLTRGAFITDWNRQDEQISIRLIGEKNDNLDPREITLDVQNKIIPLTNVAQITRIDEAEQIERIRQAPILTYNSDLSFMDWWWDSDEIQELTNRFMQQTGHEIQIRGSALQVIDLLKELGWLLGISVLLIYLILAIQYENLKYPFIIILAIPFAWIGSVFALFIGGVSLNALSFMGILILTGIAVNDSILKVDFMRRYYDETGELEEAIRQAGINRFRPVVMTSMTTILALIPMLIPFGDGYVLRQSLAIALMGGMITSTLLTLYLIPLVFKWSEGVRDSKLKI